MWTAEDLARLSPHDKARLRALGLKRARRELPTFIPSISPTYVTPWHLKPLMDVLERARVQGNVRAIVSTPPRHAKTETVLHAIAHRVHRQTTKTNAYVTYADKLSKSKSRTARRLTLQTGTKLDKSSASLAEWRTNDGGGCIATSIGGAFTGQGVDGTLVIDDPIKGRKEAESELMRETTHEWFKDVAYTRLQPGGSVIVIATRWHMDDLSGRLLGTGRWEHINLPAIDNEGRALWPEQYPVSLLEEIRETVGEYTWASLYQGQPRPRGGQLFREPAIYDEPTWPMRIVIVCDPAATKRTRADYSAIGVLGFRHYGPRLECDILEVVRVQREIPEIVKLLLELQEKWSKTSMTMNAPILVESVGGFKAVPQMLRAIDQRLEIVEITPDTDKFTRAQPAAAAWNRGRIRVPAQAPWLAPFKSEVLAFTGVNDLHDDQVDMLSHGWNHEWEYVGTDASHSPPAPSEREEDDEVDDGRRSIDRRLEELLGWRQR